MVLVIFACINPWVKKRIITGMIKAFRAINDPMRIGFFAFFSVIASNTKVISARVNTSRNGADAQPKFCPKEGTHSKRLKKVITKKAPTRSKFLRGFLTKVCLGSVKKHGNKKMTHMIEEIHMSARQLEASRISPPRVGPKITAALEISI